MKQEIIILGDIEMGGGTLTDDFISDRALIELINSLAKKKHPVDLVLNGDTFDFLKCPSFINDKKIYSRYVTERISLNKLNLIYQAHKDVFTVLKKFVQEEKNKLFFVIGNHDMDLVYRKVRKRIRKILLAKGNVFFPFKYKQHGVYAEHGQQYDLLNRLNISNIFLKYKGKSLLNIPWVSLGIMSRFLPLKEEHPLMERIKPIPLVFAHNKKIKEKINLSFIFYWLKAAFYYPFRYYYDPTYRVPRAIMGEMYHRFRKLHFELDDITKKFKRKNKRKLKKNKIHVLSHAHKKYIEEKGEMTLLLLDTWRDEYIMDSKTKMLSSKPKHYLQVLIDRKDKLSWNLVEKKIKRAPINFHEVITNELSFVRQVALEEGRNWIV